MKNSLYIFVLITAIIFFNSIDVSAQMVIGADNPPAGFSLVQLETIEKKGGFRLPRLSQLQCDALETHLNGKSVSEKGAANGLVVYNLDTGLMQYWTGTSWAALDATYKLLGVNGISEIDTMDGGLKLGGSLNQNTAINQNGQLLSFPAAGSNDVFSVMDNGGTSNTLTIKDGKVGINNTTPSAKIDIVNTDANAKGLRISNSGEDQGYLLASDYYGNAYWQPLRPLSSITEVKLHNSKPYGNNGNSNPALTNEYVLLNRNSTSPLRLSRGKWLIVAKYTGRLTGTSGSIYNSAPLTNSTTNINRDSRNFYSYLHLRKTTTPTYTGADNSYVGLTIGASLPSSQQSTYTDTVGYYVTPQVVYFAQVTAAEEYFWVVASSSKTNTTTSAYGGSYFYALRVDEILGSGVDVEGQVTNSGITVTTRNMITGQTLSSTALGNVNIKLTAGSLYLEPGNVIGHVNGIILAVGGTNNINITPANMSGVVVPVVAYGTLESYVASGIFEVPLDIPNMTASPNFAPVRINVLSQADFDFTNLQSIKIDSGKGKAITSTNSSIGFHLTSGSLTLTTGQVLGNYNGIIVTYNGNAHTYYSIGNYNIPVTISGTVSAGASGSFVIPITIQGGANENYGTFPTGGPTINVIDASLDCSVANVKSPIYTPVLVSGESIGLTMNAGSAPYTLLSNQLLGSASGLTIKYTGSNLLMTASNTYQLPISVSSGSTILGKGIYSVPLNTLNNSVRIGVAPCSLSVEVEAYGSFDCSEMPNNPIFEYPAGATDPIPVEYTGTMKVTVDNGTVTFESGEVLGQDGPISVKTANPLPVVVSGTSSTPTTVEIPVRVTGSGQVAGGSTYVYNIDVQKVGIDKCTIQLTVKQEEP